MRSHTKMMKLEKNEAHYNAIQEEYDYGVVSILEQLKQKATDFLEIM